MKLVITEPTDFSQKALKILSKQFEVHQLDNKKQLSEHINDVSTLFIRLGIQFNERLLKQAKSLKVICTPTTGLDHIDLGYCKKNNIKVFSLRGEYEFLGKIPSTAEHAWTLLMALNRNLINAHKHTQDKQWNRNLFKSYNLAGKNFGILGLGRVGKQVAQYANVFGMNVVAYDKNPAISRNNQVKLLDTPEELFQISDFISIHIPLEDVNINFVNEKLINVMKSTACIVNTSRGKVWNEEAVVNALISQKIRGVATDVIYEEMSDHPFDSPIFNIDTKRYNCIITPHIAGATYDSMQMTELFIAKKLISHVS
jgi:D-3-phosphoglycerate dehydrogenase